MNLFVELKPHSYAALLFPRSTLGGTAYLKTSSLRLRFCVTPSLRFCVTPSTTHYSTIAPSEIPGFAGTPK